VFNPLVILDFYSIGIISLNACAHFKESLRNLCGCLYPLGNFRVVEYAFK
jgi:hypothetical protein